MSPSSTLPGDFAHDVAADPDHPEEVGAFYRQAYWLAKCASLVYPPENTEPTDQEADRATLGLLKQQVEARLGSDKAPPEVTWSEFANAVADWKSKPGSSANEKIFKRLQKDEDLVDRVVKEAWKEYRHIKGRFKSLFWRWSDHEGDARNALAVWQVAKNLRNKSAEGRIKEEIGEWWPEAKVEFHRGGDTECFLAGDDALVILCFRGTEIAKIGDIISDIAAWQNTDRFSGSPETVGKVHAGFDAALDDVWPSLEPRLGLGEAAAASRKSRLEWTDQDLWITGHSLGGALAVLAAYRLAHELKKSGKAGQEIRDRKLGLVKGVVTFGQPRVGDKKFAASFAAVEPLKNRHFRFVNNNDVITWNPPKSLTWISALASRIWPKSGGTDSGVTGSGGGGERRKKFTLEYSDTGRIVLANRRRDLRLFASAASEEGSSWWRVEVLFGRLGSRLGALFMPGKVGFVRRFFPGVGDHGMKEYLRVLEHVTDKS